MTSPAGAMLTKVMRDNLRDVGPLEGHYSLSKLKCVKRSNYYNINHAVFLHDKYALEL